MSNWSLLKIEKTKKYFFHLGLLLSALTFILNFFSITQDNVYAQTTPTTSFELQIDPNTPFPASGGTFNVLLVARSDIEASNLFSAKITFPIDQILVQNININTNTFIKEPVEHIYDNTTGKISIVGGYSQGYKTNSTDNASTMATITFQRIGTSSATLHFTPSSTSDVNQTAIFSNATNQNILSLASDLVLSDSSVTDTPTPTPTDTPCNNCGGNSNNGGGDGGGGGGGGGNPSAIQGDLDNNGKVDVFDLSTLLINWNTSSAQSDIDHNGIVDVFDLSTLLINWTH